MQQKVAQLRMRRLQLKVERQGADGAWREDGGVVDVQVSSMDELCASLGGAASTPPTSVLVYTFDFFDNEWVLTADLGSVKDRDRLRVKIDAATKSLPAAVATSATLSLLFEGEGLFEGAGESTEWRALEDSYRTVAAGSITELQKSVFQAVESKAVGGGWLREFDTVALSFLIFDAASGEWVRPIGIGAIMDRSTVRIRRLTLAYDSVALKVGGLRQISPIVKHANGSVVNTAELGLSFTLLRVQKFGKTTTKEISHSEWLSIDPTTGILSGRPERSYSYKGLVASVRVQRCMEYATEKAVHFWIDEADAPEDESLVSIAQRKEVAKSLLRALTVAQSVTQGLSTALTNVIALAVHMQHTSSSPRLQVCRTFKRALATGPMRSVCDMRMHRPYHTHVCIRAPQAHCISPWHA